MFRAEDNCADCGIEKDRAMSKEREDFETPYEAFQRTCRSANHNPNDLPFWIFQEGYKACAAHYQPLLEEKDAEIDDWNKTAKTSQDELEELHKTVQEKDVKISALTDLNKIINQNAQLIYDKNTTLKALLEQAREVFEDLLDSPSIVEKATMPKYAGEQVNLVKDEHAAQVILVTHHSLHKLRKAQAALAAINAATGEK